MDFGAGQSQASHRRIVSGSGWASGRSRMWHGQIAIALQWGGGIVVVAAIGRDPLAGRRPKVLLLAAPAVLLPMPMVMLERL